MVAPVSIFPVHRLAASIRNQTNNYEKDMKYWLHKLNALNASGFSVDSIPMIQLATDAKTLQTIADAIETARFLLIQPERTTNK